MDINDFLSATKQQPNPPTPKPEGDGGALDTALDWAKSGGEGLLTALDSLGRPSRTYLHTGDLGQALDSVFDPSKASTIQDLKRDMNISNFAREDEGWLDSPSSFAAKLGDLAVDTGIGLGTDPGTLIGAGELSAAGHAMENVGLQALKVAEKASAKEGAAFLKQGLLAKGVKRELAEKAALRFEANPGSLGMADNLAGRLGEGTTRAMSVGLPFMPGVEVPLSQGIAKAGAEAAAPVLNTLGKVSDALGVGKYMLAAKRFMSESTGNRGLDAALADGNFYGNARAQEVLNSSGVMEARASALKSGWTEDELRHATTGTELLQNKEAHDAVRGITGQSVEEFGKSAGTNTATGKAYGQRSYDAADHMKAVNEVLDAKGLKGEARTKALDSYMGLVNATDQFYKLSQAALKKEGIPIPTLGQVAYRELDTARTALKDSLAGLGNPQLTEAILNAEKTGKADLLKLMDEHGVKDELAHELAKDYKAAFQTASTVPTYAAFSATPEAADVLLKAVEKDPTLARAFRNDKGEYGLAHEVNRIVQERGTKATGGRAVPGRLTLEEAVKASMGDMKGPIADKINAAMMGKGKLFEENPLLAIRNSFDYTAKAITAQERQRSIINMFGKELPKEVLAARAAVKTAREDIEKAKSAVYTSPKSDLREAAQDRLIQRQRAVELAELKLRRAEEAADVAAKHQGALPAGMTMATEVPSLASHPEAANRMLDSSLADMINKTHEAMTSASTYNFLNKTIGVYTNVFRRIQLGVPSRVLRDRFGSVIMRLQGGGIDGQYFKEMPALADFMKSLSKPVKDGLGELESMRFDIGGGQQITGTQLAKDAAELGLVDNHQLKELGSHIMNATGREATGFVNKPLKPFDWVNRMGGTLDQMDKIGMYLTRLRAGDTPAMASYLANKHLFDYTSVSPATQFLRSSGLATFPSFFMKNIPVQFEMMYTKPIQFLGLMHAKQAVEGQVPGLKEENIPKYVREKMGIVLSKNEDGSYNAVFGKNLIPMADLPSAWDPASFVQESLSPLPKAVVEAAFNINLYNKKTLNQYEDQVKGSLLGYEYSPKQEQVVKTLVGREFEPARQLYNAAQGNIDPRTGKPFSVASPQIMSLFVPIAPRAVNNQMDFIIQEKQLSDYLSAAKADYKRFNAQGDPVMAARAKAKAEKFQAELSRVRQRDAMQKSGRLQVLNANGG